MTVGPRHVPQFHGDGVLLTTCNTLKSSQDEHWTPDGIRIRRGLGAAGLQLPSFFGLGSDSGSDICLNCIRLSKQARNIAIILQYAPKIHLFGPCIL